MKTAAWTLVLAALLITIPLQAAAAANPPAPATAADAVRWNLADLYTTPEAFTTAYQKASEQAPEAG